MPLINGLQDSQWQLLQNWKNCANMQTSQCSGHSHWIKPWIHTV